MRTQARLEHANAEHLAYRQSMSDHADEMARQKEVGACCKRPIAFAPVVEPCIRVPAATEQRLAQTEPSFKLALQAFCFDWAHGMVPSHAARAMLRSMPTLRWLQVCEDALAQLKSAQSGGPTADASGATQAASADELQKKCRVALEALRQQNTALLQRCVRQQVGMLTGARMHLHAHACMHACMALHFVSFVRAWKGPRSFE